MADKKLTELPITTGLSENDLIYVVQGGISKQIKYSDFEISNTGDENRIIQLSPLSIVTDPNDPNGVALKIPVVPLIPIWRISSIDYSKTTETIMPIPYAGNDMYRVDIIVGNTNNEFVRIQGQERADVGVPPDIPNGTIEITRLNIFGQNVGDPSPPPSYGYITKSSKQYRNKRLTTIAPTELLLSPEYSTYSLEAWAGSGIVKGFISFTNNVTYDGMDIFIKNNRNIDIILTHNDANASIPFWFKSGTDFVLKQDEIIELKYNLASNRVEFVGFVGGGIQSVTGIGVDNTDPENPVIENAQGVRIADFDVPILDNGKTIFIDGKVATFKPATIAYPDKFEVLFSNTDNTTDAVAVFNAHTDWTYVFNNGSPVTSGSISFKRALWVARVDGQKVLRVQENLGVTRTNLDAELETKQNILIDKETAITAITLEAEDTNKTLTTTAATAVTITIPTGLTAHNYYQGFQGGDGVISFVGASGVTVTQPDGEVASTAGKGSAWGLYAVSATEYRLFGRLELV